ncbi:MAG TPA: hypothetical protein VG734_26025 [Lacunisphaera sp.]|jgi:hypothetical protein|nr:hypothetical protein [Lacunisphaera sp.]
MLASDRLSDEELENIMHSAGPGLVAKRRALYEAGCDSVKYEVANRDLTIAELRSEMEAMRERIAEACHALRPWDPENKIARAGGNVVVTAIGGNGASG